MKCTSSSRDTNYISLSIKRSFEWPSKKKKLLISFVKNFQRHDQVGFIPRTQGWFRFQKPLIVIQNINRLTKKIMITSIDAEGHWQNSLLIMRKTLREIEIEELLQSDPNIYKKPTSGIMLTNERLNTFSLRSGIREGCSFSPALFNIVL